MARSDEVYKAALEGKKIPLLTLDNKWHQLFTQAQAEIPADIRRGEEKLNELIRREGKLNTESKDIRRLKKKLMDEIMDVAETAGGNPDARTEKKMDDNRRLINECNEKMEAYREELKLIPEEIANTNYKLMIATMDICYRKINDNTREIEAINEWIKNIRVEIKKNLIHKEESEKTNFNLYSYMHDIFGTEVIEIFDMKYNPAERRQSKLEKVKQKQEAAGKTVIADKEI